MKAKYIGDICLPPDAVEAFARVYPQGIQERSGGIKYLRFELDIHSEEVKRIEATLHKLGMHRWDKKLPRDLSKEYKLSERVEWEPSDFKDKEYATCRPLKFGLGGSRTSDGLLKMSIGNFPSNGTIIETGSQTMCVTERVKEMIECEKFKGVEFRPTVFVSGSKLFNDMKPTPWSKSLATWWEMTSDVELPALSPTTNLLGQDHEPLVERTIQEIRRRGCLVGGPRWEALLHYRKRDLKKVEPFDLARTHERFGGPKFLYEDDDRQFVASTRFREFCQSKKWKIEWPRGGVE